MEPENRERVKVIGKYYLCHLHDSPLDLSNYKDELKKIGWAETKNPDKAHLVISSYWKYISRYIPTLADPNYVHRRLALWTQHPYHDFHEKDTNRVVIHNVYTNTVYKTIIGISFGHLRMCCH